MVRGGGGPAAVRRLGLPALGVLLAALLAGADGPLPLAEETDGMEAMVREAVEQLGSQGESGEEAAAAAGSTSVAATKAAPVLPVSAVGLRLACEERRVYWSTSCGPIASAMSRYCSHGGALAQNASCTTHFHNGSRGCGVLGLGCQSRCVIHGPPCQHGAVGFVSASDSACLTAAAEASVLVARVGGWDTTVAGAVEVAARPSGDSAVRVGWAPGEFRPVRVPLALSAAAAAFGVEATLRPHDEAAHTPVGRHVEHHVASVCPPLAGGRIVASAATVVHSEGDGAATLSVVRENGSLGAAAVDVVFISTNATMGLDFRAVPRVTTLSWAHGEAGARGVSVDVVDDRDAEGNEHLHFTLIHPVGARLGTVQPLLTLVIADDDAEAEATALEDRVRDMPFVNKIADPGMRDRFLRAWHSYPTAAGEVVLSAGEVPSFVYLIDEGSFVIRADSPRKGKGRLHEAPAGQLVGYISATKGKPMPVTFVSRSAGHLWAMSLQDLQRLSASDHALPALLRKEFLRSVLAQSPHKFPLVLIPGLMSTRLEAWKTKLCSGTSIQIREQVWLNIGKIISTLTIDKSCWLDCLALGPNQTDPPDCKVRPMSGLSAVSELHGPFKAMTTIFGDIIHHFAEKWGYDSNNIVPLPYDWRLSPFMLEKRDRYFSNMKTSIEHAVGMNKMPSILVSHSLGCLVADQFFVWLRHTFPATWKGWAHKHIISYYGLACPSLGATAALVGALIGDTFGMPISLLQARKLASQFGTQPWILPHDHQVPKGKAATRLRFTPEHLASLGGQEEVHVQDFIKVVFDLDAAGTDTLEYNLSDVSSGRLFQDIGERMNDTIALQLHDTIQAYLDSARELRSDVFNPMNRSPVRPPVENVVMIYGVDRPTKVQYRLQAGRAGVHTLKAHVAEHAKGILKDNLGANVSNTSVFKHSGDGIVPYASLSHAHTWHVSEDINVTEYPSRVIEYYDHLLAKWGARTVLSVMNTVEPRHTRYDSRKDDEWTTVIEIEGMQHRETVKHRFTIRVMDKVMLKLVEETVCQYRAEEGLLLLL